MRTAIGPGVANPAHKGPSGSKAAPSPVAPDAATSAITAARRPSSLRRALR